MKKLAFAGALALSVTSADAAVTAYTWEEDGDVKSVWSGTLNLSGLSIVQTTSGFGTQSSIQASRTYFLNTYDAYVAFSGASSSVTRLGSNDTTYTGTFSGDAFGYLTDRDFIYLDQSYQSGAEMAGSSIITGRTLAEIGISTPQTVQFTWSGDSFTHYYGVAAPVPLPAGLSLMLGGLGAFAWMRRKT